MLNMCAFTLGQFQTVQFKILGTNYYRQVLFFGNYEVWIEH